MNSSFKLDAEYFGAVKVISPVKVFHDHRGFFMTAYRDDDFAKLGLPTKFVQDNHSCSAKNVVRGLHFQLNPPMGKLMRVTSGRAFLVAVDMRQGSPTFLKWIGVEASAENFVQVWAPAEFARGFCALEDNTVVQYKCTGLYDPAGDAGVLWNDPTIGVVWPVKTPVLSDKDRKAPTVKEYLSRSHEIATKPTPKILLALVACHTKQRYSDLQRQTWVQKIPVQADYRFFFGRGGTRSPKPDEVFLDCDDSHNGLPAKIQKIIRWAYDHGYDYVMKCDDDVVLDPERLLKSGFAQFDFTGRPNTSLIHNYHWQATAKLGPTPWGFCYWLSRKAMKFLLESPLPADSGDEGWATRVLLENGIKLHCDDGYYLYSGEHIYTHDGLPVLTPPPTPNTFAICIEKNRITRTSAWIKKTDEEIFEEFRRFWSGRILITITSCVKDALNGVNQAMRDTFLKDIPKFPWLQYRFFIGDGTPTGEDETALLNSFYAEDAVVYRDKYPVVSPKPFAYIPKEDEVILHVPDDYLHGTYKTRESHRWGLERNYDYIFQCFTDTYINLHRLTKSGFERYDYSGGGTIWYASGGAGYWLSKKAAKHLLNEPITDWAEDRWTGSIMKKNGIVLHNDLRYDNYPRSPQVDNNYITSHLAITPKVYAPKMMYEVHHPCAPRPPLIAIVTCRANVLRKQALLDTWVPLARAAGYDVEFFDGERLGVPDDYVNLPLKAKAIFKWAWDHGYERVLKIDDDTYINVDRLSRVDADYAGVLCGANDFGLSHHGAKISPFPKGTFPHNYLSGGAIWFSKKALQILVETPLNHDFADDRWVGQTLAKAGISYTVLPDFHWGPRIPSGPFTLVFNVASPDEIQKLHPHVTPPLPPQDDNYMTVVIRGQTLRIPRPKRPPAKKK